MLLVDDDEAQPHRWRKDGGARADDDARFAATDAVPLLRTLLRRKCGVEHRNLIAEGMVELRSSRRRQADLRHQQNGRAIEIECPLHRRHIHRSLAGAGDAVEQVCAKASVGELLRKGVKCLLLLRIQREGLRPQTAQMEGKRPVFHADEFTAHECAQCGRGYRQ